MAITKIKAKEFVENTESAVTAVTHKATKPGEMMPIYIPKLMMYMSRGEGSGTVVTNGSMIFINDASCKPKAPATVSTQRHLNVKFANGGSWGSIVQDPEKDMVPSGTSVQVQFASKCLVNPTFTVA